MIYENVIKRERNDPKVGVATLYSLTGKRFLLTLTGTVILNLPQPILLQPFSYILKKIMKELNLSGSIPVQYFILFLIVMLLMLLQII